MNKYRLRRGACLDSLLVFALIVVVLATITVIFASDSDDNALTEFEQAIVRDGFPGVSGPTTVTNWAECSDGMLRVTFNDGRIIHTHSSNIILIKQKKEKK